MSTSTRHTAGSPSEPASRHDGASGFGSSPPPPPSRERHHLDPHEQQARALEKLLANPEKPAHIPAPPKEKGIRPPREMQKNVVGSSAGAGSGEFHVYKQARRREHERIRLMEEGANKILEASDFERRQMAQAEQDEARTDKNRAKRERKKLAALKAKAAARGEDPRKVKAKLSQAAASIGGAAGSDGDDDGESGKRRRINNQDAGSLTFRRRDQDDAEDEGDEDEDED